MKIQVWILRIHKKSAVILAVSNSSVFVVVWEQETREIQETHGADNLLFQ